MNAGRRFFIALVGITLLIAGGTLGYMLIEGMSLIDGLYMTVITITTVGYEEVQPLGTTGRVFTMVLILTGVGTAFYLFAAITELVVEGRLRDFLGKSAMHHKINQLHDHIIVCGYGRFGRVVVEELRAAGMPMVVVDNDAAKEAELVRTGLLYVIGSALDEQTLEQAGLGAAREIVVATPSDADNVYISLSARAKNPQIRIHARAESEVGLRHLNLAGVTQAISAYQWSAMRIANNIIRPSVVDFLELVIPGRGDEVDLEEIRVMPDSQLAGKPISVLEQEGERLRIVALKRGATPISIIPDASTVVVPGDLLVVIGARADLKRLVEAEKA
jgi:voltage-gated potassium channel